MKITVFGATGNVGTRVIKEALLRGHEITAVIRNNAKANQFNSTVNVDIGHANDVEDFVKFSILVILILKYTFGAKSRK